MLLVKVVKVLNKLHLPYLITGGIAVLLWGRPRFTADIDIIVELDAQNIPELHNALLKLGKTGYVDKDAMTEAIKNFGEFNFIDGNTGIKVDFWVLKKNDKFDQLRLKRKITKTILNEKVCFTSPEDLILVKLKWHAAGASSKQAEDIESIIKFCGNKLNLEYLRKMATTLSIKGLLEKFLS